MRIRFNLTHAFLGSVAVVMAASLFLTLWTLNNEQKSLKQRFRENIIWHATQAEVESNTFLRNAMRYSYGDSEVELHDVLHEFEILWSRLDVISAGSVGKNYAALDGASAAVATGREALTTLEPVVLELKRGDSAAIGLIVSRVETLIKLLHRPLMAAHNYAQTRGERQRKQTLETYSNAFIVLFGALASGGTLVLLIFLNQRKLNKLSTNLEQRVFERTHELSEKVTEVEQARLALSDQYSLLQAIIQAIPAPFFYQNDDGQLLGCNQTFERLVGFQREQIVGRTMHELGLHELVDGEDVELLRSSQSRIYESEVQFADGSRHDVMLHKAVFHKADGNVGGIIGVLPDITERKRVERELEAQRALLATRVEERTVELSTANEVLAHALRSKDEFLASMSHELRTPLNAVLGLCEALLEEVFGNLNPSQSQSLRTIEESGRHLLDLINDILDVARLGSGDLKLQLVDTPVEPVCNASIRLVRPALQRKNLSVSVSIDPDVGSLKADSRRLKQILVNLLSNATKFTPECGSVGLEVEADREHHALRFIVWDTGIGVSEANMEKLFQPFVQLDASLARQYEGSGLGLTLVYNMVEMHGGGVKVESEVGVGSRFTVTLPWRPPDSLTAEIESPDSQQLLEYQAKPAHAGCDERVVEIEIDPSASTAAVEQPEGGRELILVAEDNAANASTVTQYLQAKGYRTVTAHDGSDAIRAARHQLPDLILMDIQMPGMDGLEAIQQLRDDARFTRVPILVLTALAMPGDRERCLAGGADDYLSKPVRLRQMAEKIAFLLAVKSNS